MKILLKQTNISSSSSALAWPLLRLSFASGLSPPWLVFQFGDLEIRTGERRHDIRSRTRDSRR